MPKITQSQKRVEFSRSVVEGGASSENSTPAEGGFSRNFAPHLCRPRRPARPFLSLLALISRGREREGGREGEQQFLVSAGRTEGRTPQLKLLSRARTKVNYAFRRNAAPVNRARTPRRLCPHSRGLTRCISCAQEAVA